MIFETKVHAKYSDLVTFASITTGKTTAIARYYLAAYIIESKLIFFFEN